MNDLSYVELHGERVAYREAGSGEPIVLIHGMAGSSQTWQPVISELAKAHRVIAPDLLGHGQSAKPRTDYSLGAFAAGLRDLLNELGIRQATIVGHSLGGGVAMQFLYQHPEYCQRLILVSSGGLGTDVGWFLRLLAAPGTELMMPVVAPKMVLPIGNRIGSWLKKVGLGSPRAEPIWAAYSSLSDPPTRAAFLRTLRSVVDYRGQSVSALSRLRLRAEVPTLVIWGDRDQIIPIEHGYGVQTARPGSRLQVLPGLGHFPQVESPTEVASAIEEFIASTPGAAEASPASFGVSEDHREVKPMKMRALVDHLKSRKQIDVVIGVLAGLRGCSPDEAAQDFIDAVHETDVNAGEFGRALIDLASGHEPSSHKAEALQRWGHLLALRGRVGDQHEGAGNTSVRVRYGPENESTIC